MNDTENKTNTLQKIYNISNQLVSIKCRHCGVYDKLFILSIYLLGGGMAYLDHKRLEIQPTSVQ